MPTSPIVIVGAGHAGAQLCAALVESGLGPRVHLVCEEEVLAYQRPPLSKSFLKNTAEVIQPLKSDAWYQDAGITLYRSDPAVSLSPDGHKLRLKGGTELHYGQLILATGTRARRLESLPESLQNVLVLRTAADARSLRERLAQIKKITVLGGGFIGLEIAATARDLGLEVEVLESGQRLLARSVSATVAEHVRATHDANGVIFKFGVQVGDFDIQGNQLISMRVDQIAQSVELLVLGIGAVAETQLAQTAGLAVDNGILVDAAMRTSVPDILAVGDCANFPAKGAARRLRLESVQNANDQARVAAATLQGLDSSYTSIPWFWSEQGAIRLQMVGLMPDEGIQYQRPGANASSFSILHYQGSKLMCVESVNSPMDHMVARKLIGAGIHPEPMRLSDGTQTMKSFL